MKSNLIFYIITACLFLCTNIVKGQIILPDPPGENGDAYSIETGSSLNFGIITLSDVSGSGTVSVSNEGSRTNTGSVVLLNGIASEPASFYLTLPANRVFQIITPAIIELNGSNGGVVNLTLGDLSIPKNSSGTYDSDLDGTKMEIYIGGTLGIGPITSNPGGTYSGSFAVTFTVQ